MGGVLVVLVLLVVVVVTTGKQSQPPGLARDGSLTKVGGNAANSGLSVLVHTLSSDHHIILQCVRSPWSITQ